MSQVASICKRINELEAEMEEARSMQEILPMLDEHDTLTDRLARLLAA